MGISLKDLSKSEDDELVFNRREKLLKKLKIMAIGIFILIIIVAVIAFLYRNMIYSQESRLKLISTDMVNISAKILTINSEHQMDPEKTPLIGLSMETGIVDKEPVKPYVVTVNGNTEEYKYGYYLVSPEEMATMMTLLNLPNEWYLVNYSTGDVVNYYGVKYKNQIYYSLADIRALAQNKTPLSKYAISIRTAADMNKIRQNPAGYYKLSNDIDMSEFAANDGWTPIDIFTGYFDGRGYTISNLTVALPAKAYCGLFAEVKNTATITNVKFKDADIKGGEYTGVLAGYCSGNINLCKINSAKIEGQAHTGGLVGGYDKATISNCYMENVTIAGTNAIGGIVGTLFSGTIEKSYATGKISGVQGIGGLVGRTKANDITYIRQCYANTLINSKNAAGGLVGEIESLSENILQISDSYAKGSIAGGESNCGGFVGSIYVMNGARVLLNSLYTTADVLPTIETRGGFVGSVTVAVGGEVSPIRTIWEKDPLLDINLRDIGVMISQGVGFVFDAKTPLEMKKRVTYGDWDINIWTIEENVDTPVLRWQTVKTTGK